MYKISNPLCDYLNVAPSYNIIKNLDKINYNDYNGIIKIIDSNNLHKDRNRPSLRFFNMLKQKNGKEIREAAIMIFDGVNTHGTEIPVDERLLDCLKDFYQQRLDEVNAIFNSL